MLFIKALYFYYLANTTGFIVLLLHDYFLRITSNLYYSKATIAFQRPSLLILFVSTFSFVTYSRVRTKSSTTESKKLQLGNVLLSVVSQIKKPSSLIKGVISVMVRSVACIMGPS